MTFSPWRREKLTFKLCNVKELKTENQTTKEESSKKIRQNQKLCQFLIDKADSMP